MSDAFDCIVIGAGVVGLAVARRLAMAGQAVGCVEAEGSIGMHTSSRNSEVIHAGIYYPTGSLKARLCVEGRERLYEYCRSRNVPCNRIGKLIVAASEQDAPKLEEIYRRGVANGVPELQLIERDRLQQLEPAVRARVGLLSGTTGIVDSHGFMLALQGELEAGGGFVVCNSEVVGISDAQGAFLVTLRDGSSARCNRLVNAAGLRAPAIAARIEGFPADFVPQARFAKAHYFSYAGRSPFSRLIYPVPEDGGLGVHATLDLDGGLRFGPDVEWVQDVDYTFDESRRERFISAIRRWFPDLEPARLAPGYTGVRPKLSAAGEPAADFRIDGPSMHGMPGLVNLFGIESPGLTASLAIADRVAEELT